MHTNSTEITAPAAKQPAQNSRLRRLLLEQGANCEDSLVWEMDYDGAPLPGKSPHSGEKLSDWLAANHMSPLQPNGRAEERACAAVDLQLAKEALQQTQGQLFAIIQSAMDGIVTVDEQQRVVLFNPAAEEMFGLSAAEALGRPLGDFIPMRFRADHFDQVRDFGRTSFTQRKMGQLQCLTALRADGTEFPAEISISQIGVEGQKLFTAILRDLTERQRAEERARRLAAIVDSSSDAILSKDLSGRILSWNRGAEYLYGYSEAEIVGQPVSVLVPPDRQDEVSQALREIAEGLCVTRTDTFRRRKDGSMVEVSLVISPVRDSQGRITGASTIAHDISERKRAEQAVRESTEHYQQLFERSANAIALCEMVFDAKGDPCDYRFLDVNPAFEQMTGWRRETTVGRTVMEIIPGVERYWIDLFGKVATTGRTVTFDHFAQPLGRYYAGNAYCPRPGQFVASFVNITERKRAEKELARKLQELARSNHDLEQFAYVASHDLQEPLRMVAAYTQLLAERYRGKLDEKADQFIAYASDGALRMQGLIQDLLAFSRVGHKGSAAQNVDCKLVIEEVLRNLGPAIHESGAVIQSRDLPVVCADRRQLVQLFQNLIGNAIKFHGSKPPAVSIAVKKTEGQWQFSVTDNGIGIAAEHSAGIFGVFHRLHTRDEYPGNGIGLAICKKVVEQYGGKIWVESQVGQGSSFKFTLPAQSCNGGPQ